MNDENTATATQAGAGGARAVSLVPMSREPWEANGGPVACDVHPDEVENYRRGGWKVVVQASRAAPDRKGGK
jgi:hypothetical protein